MADPDLSHLERLEAEATAGRWLTLQVSAWDRGAIVDDRQTELCDWPAEQRANMEFLVALRNSAKWLLERAREAERLREEKLDWRGSFNTVMAELVAARNVVTELRADVALLREAPQSVMAVSSDREAFVMQGPRAFARAEQIAKQALAATEPNAPASPAPLPLTPDQIGTTEA